MSKASIVSTGWLAVATLCSAGASVAAEKNVDLGDYALHFVVTDQNSDRTILLEAGGGADSSMWSELQGQLADSTGYNVISYDRAGFGGSTPGPADLAPAAQLDDLAGALGQLGYAGDLILVAHSYGGLLSQQFAARQPDKVIGMLLIDPMNAGFVARYGEDRLLAKAPDIENPANDKELALMRMVRTMPALLASMQGVALPAETPVYVISAGSPPYDDTQQDIDDWHLSHADMVKASPHHVLVEAPDNSHDVVHENPVLIIETMAKLISAVNARQMGSNRFMSIDRGHCTEQARFMPGQALILCYAGTKNRFHPFNAFNEKSVRPL